MKSYTKYLIFNTKKRQEFINITAQVEDLVAYSDIKDGLYVVNAMHITASIFAHDKNSMHQNGRFQVQHKAGNVTIGGV